MDAAERELRAVVAPAPDRDGRSGGRGVWAQGCEEGEAGGEGDEGAVAFKCRMFKIHLYA